jgi:hypothetical protein
MSICKGKLKDGTDCSYSVNIKADPSGRFCARHKYLSKYTEEKLKLCEHCSNCKRWIHLEGFKTCKNCRERSKQNRKVSKENKGNLPDCDTCVSNNCKKINKGVKVNEYGNKYCGTHYTMSTWLDKLEANGRKPCDQYNRKCPTKEGLPKDSLETRCEYCSKKYLSKSRENDKMRKERRKREKATGNTCVKCHQVFNDPLEFIDERLNKTTRCKECRENFREYDRKARNLGIKKSYPMSEETKMKKRLWRENNREKMIEYCLKHRAKKMQEMGEEYWKVRAQWQKKWRKQNPEKVAANNHKKRTDPKYKLKYYKDRAQRSNIEWDLSDDECFEYFEACCYFCGEECGESNNGIDRLNNNIGYTHVNTVTCCEMCNMMKGNLSEDIFIERCRYILAYNGSIDEDIPCTSAYPLRTCCKYPNYKSRAVSKLKTSFELTQDDYYRLINSECYICGTETFYRNVNGIDRISNDIGYTINNVQTCCAECNYLKCAYEYDEFIDKLQQIHRNYKRKRNHENGDISIRKDMLAIYLYNETEKCFVRTNYVIENVSIGEWKVDCDIKNHSLNLQKHNSKKTDEERYVIDSGTCNIPYIMLSQSHNKMIEVNPNDILNDIEKPSLLKIINQCAILATNCKQSNRLELILTKHDNYVVGIKIQYVDHEFQDSMSSCKCLKCEEHWNNNGYCKCSRCIDHVCHSVIDGCYWCSQTGYYYEETVKCPIKITSLDRDLSCKYIGDEIGVGYPIDNYDCYDRYRKLNRDINDKEFSMGMLSVISQNRNKPSKETIRERHKQKIKIRKAQRIENYSNPEWRKERAKRIVKVRRAV